MLLQIQSKLKKGKKKWKEETNTKVTYWQKIVQFWFFHLFLSLFFKFVNQLFSVSPSFLDVLEALKNICRFYCTVCMTFWACEAVFLLCENTRTEAHGLNKIHQLKKKVMYLQSSFPSFTLETVGSGPHCSAGRGGMWLSLKHMPNQICSTNISLSQRHNMKGISKLLAH